MSCLSSEWSYLAFTWSFPLLVVDAWILQRREGEKMWEGEVGFWPVGPVIFTRWTRLRYPLLSMAVERIHCIQQVNMPWAASWILLSCRLLQAVDFFCVFPIGTGGGLHVGFIGGYWYNASFFRTKIHLDVYLCECSRSDHREAFIFTRWSINL